jgi:hypothetical protein
MRNRKRTIAMSKRGQPKSEPQLPDFLARLKKLYGEKNEGYRSRPSRF